MADIPTLPSDLTESLPNDVATHTTHPSTPPKRTWWKEAIVYQVYPPSFYDSNGDGLGDIPGITCKLDHIHHLGADLVWLCPVYKSPQVDMGYDISDYKAIHEPYGTLEDVDTLILELKKRGMKLVMDLVVNHTSDQHEWFQKSRSSKSKENEYRDWYIWQDPKYDKHGNRHPPNNWASYFGGSAWEWDEPTQQYYLHIFAKAQPDLNWENPAVVEAVHDVMRFWLEKGVAGFRMDVINFISKVPGFPDAPITVPSAEYQYGDKWYAAGPRLHEFLKGLGDILREYDGFSVGEMPCVYDLVEIVKAVGAERGELNMVINFEMVDIDMGPKGKYSPKQWGTRDVKRILSKWQTFMYENDGWNALYLENHDQSRSVHRFLSPPPEVRRYAAKMLATFLGCQGGTLFVYQGQEIGMGNIPEGWGVEEFKDVETVNHWAELIKNHPDDKELQKQTMAQYRLKARDNARTPVQWSTATNAGFSIDATARPWMRVNPEYESGWNVATQSPDPYSVLSYWKKILKLRKSASDIFVYGKFELLDDGNEDVVAYLRKGWGGQRGVVVCNFRGKEIDWRVPSGLGVGEGKVVCGNHEGGFVVDGEVLRLKPFQCFVSLLPGHG